MSKGDVKRHNGLHFIQWGENTRLENNVRYHTRAYAKMASTDEEHIKEQHGLHADPEPEVLSEEQMNELSIRFPWEAELQTIS